MTDDGRTLTPAHFAPSDLDAEAGKHASATTTSGELEGAAGEQERSADWVLWALPLAMVVAIVLGTAAMFMR